MKTLSDEIVDANISGLVSAWRKVIEVKDVKEFIKRLKEYIDSPDDMKDKFLRWKLQRRIDNLAGEKLK